MNEAAQTIMDRVVKKLKDELVALREDNGKTLSSIAKMSGVSAGTVHKLTHKDYYANPRIATLIAVVEAYGGTVKITVEKNSEPFVTNAKNTLKGSDVF